MENLLSIVIPCKNEESGIGKLFESILRQDKLNASKVEIIVADAGSTDRTLEIIRSYKDKLDIQVVPGGLPSVGRNNGARMAKTKYILFVDADIELPSDMLYETIRLAEQKELYCLSSWVKLMSTNKLASFIFWFIYKYGHKFNFFTGPFSMGTFICMRADVFTSLGGFDERLVFAEDTYLVAQVPRNRFGVVPRYISTGDRRIQKMGLPKVLWMGFETFIYKNNQKYFWRDKAGYWTV